LTRLWRAALVAIALTGLAGWWLSPYVLSNYWLDAGASALDEALLPVYHDRLAPEQVVDWDKLEQATAHLQQSLNWDDRSIRARRLLARVYLSVGEPERSLEMLKAALTARPSSPLLWLELGDVYDCLGDSQAALEAYEAGRLGSRVLPVAANYLLVAEVQRERGNGEAAIAEWRRVLELDSSNLYALCQLADIHREMGDSRCAAGFEETLERIGAGAVAVPLDFRLAEYQALAAVWLVGDGIWDQQTLVAVMSRHVSASGGELQQLMAQRELETIMNQYSEEEGSAFLDSVLLARQ